MTEAIVLWYDGFFLMENKMNAQNPVDFNAQELRVLANMNMWDIRPRGHRISAPDFLIGLNRAPVEAPNATSIRLIKERTNIKPSDFDFVPFIHRVRSGLQ